MTWQIRQREAELLGEKRGIAIGEERGIAIGEERGEKRGIAIGEERGIAIGKELGEKCGIAIGEKRGEERGEKARQTGNGAGYAEGTALRPGRALHGPFAGRTTIAGQRNCSAGLKGDRI